MDNKETKKEKVVLLTLAKEQNFSAIATIFEALNNECSDLKIAANKSGHIEIYYYNYYKG